MLSLQVLLVDFKCGSGIWLLLMRMLTWVFCSVDCCVLCLWNYCKLTRCGNLMDQVERTAGDALHCKNEVWIPHHWCNIWYCKSGNHTKIGVADTLQCHILHHIFTVWYLKSLLCHLHYTSEHLYIVSSYPWNGIIFTCYFKYKESC